MKKVKISDILDGNINALSKAISLVESTKEEDIKESYSLLEQIQKEAKKTQSFRIGISGSPGVGKSSLIEEIGYWFCQKGLKVAVLAIDPSSPVSKGSILADKTRMLKLSSHPNSFIRPSPSLGIFGGTNYTSYESILLCESAGFEIIFLETVGVGQVDFDVSYLVDCFLLLLSPGSGDEIQAIKRGIIEMCHIICVTKYDGELKKNAAKLKSDLESSINLTKDIYDFWQVPVLSSSIKDMLSIEKLVDNLEKFSFASKQNGFWQKNKYIQRKNYFDRCFENNLIRHFRQGKKFRKVLEDTKEKFLSDKISLRRAIDSVLVKIINEDN